MQTFEPWGVDHLVVLGLTFGIPVASAVWSARDPDGRRERFIEIGFAVILCAQLIAGLFLVGLPTARTWADVMPLQLCHLALFACVGACLARSQFAYEIAYFWGLAGTIQGLVTPGLSRGFPSAEYFVFFVGHGGIVATVLFLTITGRRPGKNSWERALLALLVYAAAVGVFNAVFDQNYGFLCVKPPVPTLFDWLGPWPWYIGTAAILAALLFFLLYLPWGMVSRVRNRPPGESLG